MAARTIAGKRALVTGASSGLGADFASELARRGAHLIIVARRREALEELAAHLRAEHGVEVTAMNADLSLPDAARDLYDRISAAGLAVDVLVNNAGIGLYGRSVQIPWDKERGMLQLDVVTLAGLTKLLLPQMLERRFGYILNVSTIGAYQPTPLYASYSAAKTYVLFYSEALRHELRGSGVSVTAVAPGITATEFLKVSGQEATAYQRLVMMQSQQVVHIAVEAMLAGRATVIPGFLNAALVAISRLSPRPIAIRVAELLMRSNVPRH